MVKEEVMVNRVPIKLDQFLKWAAIASTGGEAKILIQESRVKINGKTELQRGRQLFDKDLVEIEDIGVFKVIVDG